MVESSSLICPLYDHLQQTVQRNQVLESAIKCCWATEQIHLTLDSEDRILQPDKILDPSGVSRQQSA
jgi:hypothetical protein